jgi:HTH-type transcriptional regulator/antitoxin HipB
MKPSQSNETKELSTKIATVADLGSAVLRARKEQGLTQVDIAGLAETGNRFIVDLEKGKPTIQFQKTLDILDLLGLELTVRKKVTR